MKNFIAKTTLISAFILSFAAIPLSINAQQNINFKNSGPKKRENVDVSFSEFEEPESFDELKKDFFDEGEEKIVISIINFGRKNPFKPYSPSKIIKSNKEVFDLDEVPLPPEYKKSAEMEQQAAMLLKSKVNGILYDPSGRSVAIVNLSGSEHMVHKGDIVEGIEVNEISKSSVTLRYGNNSYTASVGEVVEGEVVQSSVQRSQSAFGGYGNHSQEPGYTPESDYKLPDVNLEGYTN